jgi:hypothetical protein
VLIQVSLAIEVSMANLHETSNLERIAEIDLFGWLFAALVVVVTAGAWMIAYNASNVTISTTVLAGSPG